MDNNLNKKVVNFTKIMMMLLIGLFLFFTLAIFCVNIVSDGKVGVRNTLGDYKDNELKTRIIYQFH